MKKAVIYARFSDDDLQNIRSIEDQNRVVAERAKKEGYEVVGYYSDPGISGFSMKLRPGIQALMRDSVQKKFDVVWAESLDRISRDQEDSAYIYKRLTKFLGINIYTLAHGLVTPMEIGMKGTMNSMFLDELALKTHRGQRGVVEEGRSGGGNAFGYDVVKRFDEKGNPVHGERTINREEADIVVSIFENFASGKSPKAIAKSLNALGVPAPGGKGWGPSTIYGNRNRGTGILNNELYIGEIVWNKLRYIKDPDTGKRVSRENPPEEYVRKAVPHLRIVDQALWDAVKDVQGIIKAQHKQFWGKQRPRSLLNGLMKCGCCGAGVGKINSQRLGCFGAYNKGTCDNKLSIKADEVEQSVIRALHTHLIDPDLCQAYCDEFIRYSKQLRLENNKQRALHEQELLKCQKEDRRMVDLLIEGAVTVGAMKDRMAKNTQRIAELEEILSEKPIEAPLLLPNMGIHYRSEVGKLIEYLKDEKHKAEAILKIRSLVDKIVLTPSEDGESLVVDLHGDLAAILTVATGRLKPLEEIEAIAEQVKTMTDVLGGSEATESQKKTPLARGQSSDSVKMVAGACNRLTEPGPEPVSGNKMVAGRGFEPLTFRL